MRKVESSISGCEAAIACAGRWSRGRHVAARAGRSRGQRRCADRRPRGGRLARRATARARSPLEGGVDAVEVRIQGSGDADLESLRAPEARILINGSGNASAHVTDTIIATVNGTGEIVYRGEPRNVTEDVNGTGSVGRRKN